jgi:hypothetical protein
LKLRVAPLSIFFVAISQVFCTGVAFSGALLHVEGRMLRWEPASPAAGTVITYSVLTGPYSVPGNKSILSPSNCAAMHPFSGILAESPGVSEDAARRELRAAFAAWEKVANVAFAEVSDPHAANIVVGAESIPQGKAFANLSYQSRLALASSTASVAKALGDAKTTPPVSSNSAGQDKGATAIDQAYVCLNPKTPWKIGFDGNIDVYDLRYTFTHEIGHAIGLDHPDTTEALMAYHYDEHIHGLQLSDIAAVQRLYGPPTH